MVKIKKKKNQSERLKHLADLLQYPAFVENYPRENDECWRRYSPQKMLDQLEVAAQAKISNGTLAYKATPSSPSTNAPQIKTLDQWKSEDETFYREIKANLEQGALPEHDPYTGAAPARFFRDLTANRLAGDTLVLRIAPNTRTEEPLELEWSAPNSTELNIKGLIIATGENSDTTIFARHLGAAFDIALYRMELSKNSRLEFQLLYDLPTKENSGVCHIETTLGQNSTAKLGLYTASTHKAKIFTQSLLDEKATIDYYGVHAGDHSHVDHDYHLIHRGDHSKSNINFKAALLNNANGIFWGNTAILPGTAGCEGYQSNKNLILGKGSRVDAIPKLEILTEDVAASHGSATGEISEEQMFYLMSRGLSQPEAQNLLLRGFFEDILHNALTSDDSASAFKKEIWTKLEARLHLESSPDQE